MNLSRRIFLSLSLCLVASPSWAALSEAEKKAALSFVESKQKQVSAAVKAGQSAKVDQLFDSMFDYDYLAKESLGKHWDGATEAQRSEFKKLLQTLVRRAYRKNIDKTLEYEITYHGAAEAAHGVLVKTRAKNKKDPREEPLSIDYVVFRISGGYRVHDVVTEGSSLVANYRKSFNRIIRKKGMDGLLKKMRDKADEKE